VGGGGGGGSKERPQSGTTPNNDRNMMMEKLKGLKIENKKLITLLRDSERLFY
jgi:hypothetical protein